MKKLLSTLAVAATMAFGLPATQAQAQSEPFIGQISWFGGNFAPRGWAFCDGQLLPINANSALFSILGTIYGGDGRSTFALPDMRGRVPVHEGNGPGLSNYVLGSKGGRESVVLTVSEIPAHNHVASLRGTSSAAGSDVTAEGILASATIYGGRGSTIDASMASGSVTIGNTGGGQPFDIRQPYLAINCIIALQGLFPSRS